MERTSINLYEEERPFSHPGMPEGMTQEEYADWLYQRREEIEGWEEVEAEISPDLASVVSVRLHRTELTAVEAAARAAGLTVPSFIRQAAIAATSARQNG